MAIISIGIVNSRHQLEAFASQPTQRGRIAVRQVQDLLLDLESEPPLLQQHFYKSHRDNLVCYLKQMGPNLYLIMVDDEAATDTLDEYCDDLTHILLTKQYNELNNMVADSTYAVSPIRKLKQQLAQLKNIAMNNVDLLMQRYGRLDDLLQRTEKLQAERPDFKLALRLPKRVSPANKAAQFFCSFFSFSDNKEKQGRKLSDGIRFGIN